MTTLLTKKMFRNYNSSLQSQHMIHHSVFVFTEFSKVYHLFIQTYVSRNVLFVNNGQSHPSLLIYV